MRERDGLVIRVLTGLAGEADVGIREKGAIVDTCGG